MTRSVVAWMEKIPHKTYILYPQVRRVFTTRNCRKENHIVTKFFSSKIYVLCSQKLALQSRSGLKRFKVIAKMATPLLAKDFFITSAFPFCLSGCNKITVITMMNNKDLLLFVLHFCSFVSIRDTNSSSSTKKTKCFLLGRREIEME